MKEKINTNNKKAKTILLVIAFFIIYLIWFAKLNLTAFEGGLYLYFLGWVIFSIYKLSQKGMFGEVSNSVIEIINILAVNFIYGILMLFYFVLVFYIMATVFSFFYNTDFTRNYHYLFFAVIGLFSLTKFEKLILRNAIKQYYFK